MIYRLLPALCVILNLSAQTPVPRDSATADSTGDNLWYNLQLFHIEGRGWRDTRLPYDRLPAAAEKRVRSNVWDLSRDAAGMCARFVTDAVYIKARWKLGKPQLAMNHFPATGVSGIDLYVRRPGGAWHWLAVGRPDSTDCEQMLVPEMVSGEKREFLLYLPLYNQLIALDLGFPRGAEVFRAPPRPGREKPVVFYGTSITQGGCASRPGMTHVAQLGRMLDREVINLGFSGNGFMEPELAGLLAGLDPAIYVLDCLPNLKPDEVLERVAPFVRTLRKARPNTPVLLMDTPDYANGFLIKERKERMLGSRKNLLKVFKDLQARGVTNIHYLPGENLFGPDGEGTVDGTHPTDLGFTRQAGVMAPVLKSLLK